MTKSVISVWVLCITGFIDTMQIKSPPPKNGVFRTDNILGKDNIKLNYVIEGKVIKILQFHLPYRSPK